MVVLKILQQHYNATGDERVIDFMTRYFRYQLNTLPSTPLGNWTFWAEYRACDNLNAVLWLYDKTGDAWLLDLAKILHEQSYDYVHMFLETEDLAKINTIHCVNLAQGIKEPVIWWRVDPQQRYLDAVKQGFADIRQYNGYPNGMYGGDDVQVTLRCHKSLAIVNEVLYYKSRSAICSYDGSLPVEISSALGDESYSNAVAGAFGNKYYISCEERDDITKRVEEFIKPHDTRENI